MGSLLIWTLAISCFLLKNAVSECPSSTSAFAATGCVCRGRGEIIACNGRSIDNVTEAIKRDSAESSSFIEGITEM